MKRVKEEIESCGYENVGYGERIFSALLGAGLVWRG